MAHKLDRLIDALPEGGSGQRRTGAAPPAYGAADFRADLDLITRSLDAAGLGDLAASGGLADARVRAETFGFHLAALDLRQHSALHEAAVADLLKRAGVEPDYAALGEDDRLALLTRELKNPRPFIRLGRGRSGRKRTACSRPSAWRRRPSSRSPSRSAPTSSP